MDAPGDFENAVAAMKDDDPAAVYGALVNMSRFLDRLGAEAKEVLEDLSIRAQENKA